MPAGYLGGLVSYCLFLPLPAMTFRSLAGDLHLSGTYRNDGIILGISDLSHDTLWL